MGMRSRYVTRSNGVVGQKWSIRKLPTIQWGGLGENNSISLTFMINMRKNLDVSSLNNLQETSFWLLKSSILFF